ncbi:PIN domain-containing protein [Saccharothrix sp. S26]|uniref:PIN domain-containing protein n=1 Tax=Saccharothrix sp. S26 TaxID=2907215 RepID=UPI001F1B8CB3|nr:PIN domain-containing protein [Saccharothrix sp. S26]MCE6993460.1 PIN domain-containing protein [Saccharothrix sp. S26]
MAVTRVFADTNTLFPFYVCDLLLHCAEEDLFRVLWTEDLLSELVDVVSRSGQKSRRAVTGLCAAIRQVFPDDEVPRSTYAHLIAEMPGSDPDDRVHSAAALAGNADLLLTRDTKGFPKAALGRRGLRVTTADQFLCEQFAAFPDDLVRVVRNQVDDLTKSRLTVDELLDRLSHPTGTPRFATRVRRRLK